MILLPVPLVTLTVAGGLASPSLLRCFPLLSPDGSTLWRGAECFWLKSEMSEIAGESCPGMCLSGGGERDRASQG
ncbi:hypothetical protein V8C44DRAFT_345731 [Trichoderma aethiopicum]